MQALLLILLMNLLYAGAPTFMKLAARELDPFQIVYLRHTLAALIFIPILLFRKDFRLQRNDFLMILFCAFIAFTLASLLQIVGIRMSQATDGTFIASMEPVATIAMAVLFLGEKLTRKMKMGLILACIGFVILSYQTSDFSGATPHRWIGNLLFLLAVLGEAMFPILLKPLLSRYSPCVVAFYCLLCASIYMLPFQGLEMWQQLPTRSLATLGSVAYLGLGCSFLACFIWLSSLQYFSVSLLALSWFSQPLFGCLFALILLKEPLTSNTLAGGVLILLALALLKQKEAKQEKGVTSVAVRYAPSVVKAVIRRKRKIQSHPLALHFPVRRIQHHPHHAIH
ncbi:MAG: DMT family transporter [Deltaproteobacteria bacterium]|nr:DMT family transporter [Deltaproteobacteria bacterium]